MTQPKLTPWFPPDTKPARPGVYQRDYRDGAIRYAYFGNTVWYLGAKTPEDAINMHVPRNRIFISGDQNLPWRGIQK